MVVLDIFPDITSLAILCLFAFTAGFVDAVSGGGGLIQLPALFILQPQLTLVQTLATNKMSSFAGTSVAAVRYIKKVDINWRHLTPAIIASLVASFGGALLVSYIHKEQFMPFIITALVLVLLYTVFKKELGLRHDVKQHSKNRSVIYAAIVGGVLGLYEGLIGPGTGSFLIFAFITLFGYDFLHASANAKVINITANIGALLFFVYHGFVVWSIAIPIAIANMTGNYAGSHMAIKKGSKFIRLFFIAISLALIVKLSYDYL
ncbi:MAG: TSUP family transporter [Chitinophagales bacterium]|nr:TSUP family transporter [Chitinophagaceae bacterium]MCB9063962.1 TSUP family transporter [Chitinophagales bacterium]